MPDINHQGKDIVYRCMRRKKVGPGGGGEAAVAAASAASVYVCVLISTIKDRLSYCFIKFTKHLELSRHIRIQFHAHAHTGIVL